MRQKERIYRGKAESRDERVSGSGGYDPTDFPWCVNHYLTLRGTLNGKPGATRTKSLWDYGSRRASFWRGKAQSPKETLDG